MAALAAYYFSSPTYEVVSNACVCGVDAERGDTVTAAPLVVLPADDGSDYGVDLDILTDTRASLSLAAGLRNIGNAIARRVTTPRGTLFYDLDYGFDVRAFLNAGFTIDQLSRLQAQISTEVEKDPRVDSADVTLSPDIENQKMTITIRLELATGPFELILGVSALTVDLLELRALS